MRKVRCALLAAIMVLTGLVAAVPHATAAGNYRVSINDVSAVEGSILAFVVSVSPVPATSDSVSVTATTNNGSASGGTACPGADFVTQTATLVMTAQSPRAKFDVQTCNDATDEPSETMTVALSSPSATCVNVPMPCSAAIVDASGLGTILNNDEASPPEVTPTPPVAGPPTLAVVDVVGAVGKTQDCLFHVNRLGDASGTATVRFFSSAKPKLAANVSGTLVFASGETVKQVIVDVLKRPRHAKFVTLFIAGATGATITDDTGLCTLKPRRDRR